MCTLTEPKIDSRALRDTLGAYPTGVAVVTAAAIDAKPVGMTINSFVSISLRPALVGWCIDRRSGSYDEFALCTHFAISVLAEEQEDIARRFAQKGADKFIGMDVERGIAPVVPGAAAWLQCRLYRQLPLGDHLMIVGEVLDCERTDLPSLIFAQGEFGCVEYPAPSLPLTLLGEDSASESAAA